MTRWEWSANRAGKTSAGVAWMRPFAAAVPWITVVLLLLMFHMIGGTMTSAEGVLFDLPDAGSAEGEETKLVALVMPMTRESARRETLVFFDDARYMLGDEASESVFIEQLAERSSKTGDRTLLVLADRRVAGGELMRVAALAKKGGVKRLLFAERKDRESGT